MLKTLFYHQRLRKLRLDGEGSYFMKRILSALLFIFICTYLIFIGFLISVILKSNEQGSGLIKFLDQILLPFILMDLSIKTLFKDQGMIQVIPYMNKPISLNKIFDFILIKDLYSIWNIYMLTLFLPVAIMNMVPSQGLADSIVFLFTLYSYSILSSLFARFLKDFIVTKSLMIGLLIFGAIIALLTVLNKFSLGIASIWFQTPILILTSVISVTVLLWILIRKRMRISLYNQIDSGLDQKNISVSSINLFSRFGETGRYMDLFIVRTLRCKRLKGFLFGITYFTLFAVLQSFIYRDKGYFVHSSIFFALFGFLGATFIQFGTALESPYFDSLYTKPIQLSAFYRARYILNVCISTVLYLLFLPMLALNDYSILTITANYFIVIGPVYFILFQYNAYNKKRFELYESYFMNYNGNTFGMLVTTLLAIVVPYGTEYFTMQIFSLQISNYIMIIIGACFVIFHKTWIENIFKRFDERKYVNMSGFRIKN